MRISKLGVVGILCAVGTSSAEIGVPLPAVAPTQRAIGRGLPDADSDFEPVTRSGITPDMDQTQDFALNRAFRIYGNFSGPQALRIAAIRDDGAVFMGVIDFRANSYAVVVPAGNYSLRSCYVGIVSTFDDPDPVVVTADTQRDEMLPAFTSYTVSGVVTGVSPGLFAAIDLRSQDQRTSSAGLIDPGNGTYSANAPSGIYDANVLQVDFAAGTTSSYAVGTVMVSDGDAMMDFAVGTTGQLSGTVMMTSIPPGSVMLAVDSVPSPSGFNCAVPQRTFGSGPVNPSSGFYRTTQLTGRTYFLGGAFPILPADPPQTAGTWQWIDPMLVDFQGDTVRDATVSPPAETITISGQVTVAGADGAVAAASVGAACEGPSSGTGLPPTTFARGTQTDAAGNYQLVVPNAPFMQCALTVNGPPPTP